MHRRYVIALAAILYCLGNISDGLSSADFEKRPDKYYSLTEGDKIHLPCKVKNDDHISYKWLFNDSPIKSDDNHRIWRARRHELALNSLKPEHSGKYTCIAYTTGDKRSKASVSTEVKIYEKLKMVRKPENTHVSIIEGSPLVLPCEANHPDQDLISYQWYFNDALLKYDENKKWSLSYHDLVFNSLKMNESGVYSCKVDSTLGSVSMDIHITVLEDLLANKCPSSVVVPTHHSSRNVKWTPPHAQDRTGILKHIKVHPPNAIPPFEAPLGDTLIKYTLALGNGLETSCAFQITVFAGIKITKKPERKEYNVVQGGSVFLPCHAYSKDNDHISYQWLFDDSILHYDNHRLWQADSHELHLKNLKREHSGKYTCVAYTTGERSSKAWTSTVVKIPVKLKIVKKTEKTHISIIKGYSLRLPCQANYEDEVSYEWLLNGSLIKYGSHRAWSTNHHELVIQSVQVGDSGIYTCKVDTEWDMASMGIHVTVLEDLLANKCPSSVVVPTHHSSRNVKWTPPHAQDRTGILKHIKVHPPNAIPPFEAPLGDTLIKYTLALGKGQETSCSFNITVFKGISFQHKPPSNYAFVEGVSFSVPCKAKGGHHIAYKWLFNDSPLQYDGYRSWKGNNLHMKGLLPKHSGTYTCVAFTTGERSSKISAKTVVKIKDKFLKIPDKKNIAITEGSSLRLPCHIRHNNDGIFYSWLFNGLPLKYDKHIKWQKSQHELVLKSAQIKHTGTYTCQVTTYMPNGKFSVHVHVKIRARYSFTAWSAWSKCLPSQPGSTRGHRSRSRTCVTSARIEAPGKCSGKTKQFETCDIKVSTLPPPTETPFPNTREKTVIFPVTRPVKGKGGAIVAKRKESTASKGKSKFMDTFYGKLALGSSLGIIFVILGCAVFLLVGRRMEKKDKRRRKGYRPLQSVEDPASGQRQSKDECIDEYEDEMDRRAFEKRRVIKELTPKERKRSELDDDLIVARAVILEEGVNKDHDREVAEKRKKVVKTTSSTACKKSLLESINSSRAIIMNKSPAQDGSVESASVSFSPLKEHKSRISSAGSSRDSSFHSLDGTKNARNKNAEDSFSMMMVQPVQPLSFEARQATIKQTHDFNLNQ